MFPVPKLTKCISGLSAGEPGYRSVWHSELIIHQTRTPHRWGIRTHCCTIALTAVTLVALLHWTSSVKLSGYLIIVWY